jgi:hypothetical protein
MAFRCWHIAATATMGIRMQIDAKMYISYPVGLLRFGRLAVDLDLLRAAWANKSLAIACDAERAIWSGVPVFSIWADTSSRRWFKSTPLGAFN